MLFASVGRVYLWSVSGEGRAMTQSLAPAPKASRGAAE